MHGGKYGSLISIDSSVLVLVICSKKILAKKVSARCFVLCFWEVVCYYSAPIVPRQYLDFSLCTIPIRPLQEVKLPLLPPNNFLLGSTVGKVQMQKSSFCLGTTVLGTVSRVLRRSLFMCISYYSFQINLFFLR